MWMRWWKLSVAWLCSWELPSEAVALRRETDVLQHKAALAANRFLMCNSSPEAGSEAIRRQVTLIFSLAFPVAGWVAEGKI